MPKPEWRDSHRAIRHWGFVILSSFVIRHSCSASIRHWGFVILSSFVIRYSCSASIRHWGFVILSSFVIRHSSFPLSPLNPTHVSLCNTMLTTPFTRKQYQTVPTASAAQTTPSPVSPPPQLFLRPAPPHSFPLSR